MKKIIFLAAVLIGLCTTASAQEFGWGAKAGLNVSNISNSSMDSKPGLTIGVFADYRTCDWFAVSAELLYSREGAKMTATEGGIKIKNAIKSNYLNIPILANFYVIDGLAFKVGIQPGFMLGANATSKVKDSDTSKESESISKLLHTVDFAIPVGVSYEFFEKIILDLRYNIGVSSIMKDSDTDKSRNNVFAISVGYRF